MIARWPLVARQAASLHRCALAVAERIASQPGRDAGSGWERDVVTTDAGTAVGVIVTDKSGAHLSSNRTATDLTGFSHREIVARSIWDLVPPAQREESRAVWRWFQETGVLHGSATIVPKNRVPRELQYLALADVVPGAHLSVFVPHPFEAALDLAEGGLATADRYGTLIVTSVFADSAPSLAMARTTYVPRALNVAVTSARPAVTGRAAGASNAIFAGPRICIHDTVSPRGRATADEFACA